MKKPLKLIWKIYFLIFSTMSAANLIWLLYPQADPYIFYHILITLNPFYWIYYGAGMIKCCITLICLIPLFRFAFNYESRRTSFWKRMLIVRLIADILGNFYEFMFIKASYHMILGYGLTTTGVFLLPLIPSYIAHYLYAFPNGRDQK